MNAILRNMNPVTPRKIPLAALVVLLALFASFSLFIRPVVAAELTDTTPPVLIDFDFNPKSIDVTNGDATVNITTHVTDDLSGVMGGWVHFYSPSHGQYRTAGITTYHCCPDNWTPPLDAVVQSSLTLPQSSEAGDWVVTGIELWDGTGNTQDIDTATLLSLGFPTILHVISQNPDVTPPQLNSFSVSPASIDVSSGPQSITFTMGLSDVSAGVDFSSCQVPCHWNTITLVSPSGKQTQYEHFLNVHQLSGTPQSGVWQVTVTLPKFAEAGLWKIQYLQVPDRVGNYLYLDQAGLQSRSFPSAFTVTSSPSDTQTPQLMSLAFDPNFVDTTTGRKIITLTLGAIDNLSGIDADFHLQSPNIANYPEFDFQSPSGGQLLQVFPITRLAGSPTNGTWQGTSSLPQYSEAGTWTLKSGKILDAAGNLATFNNAQLKALGFPTTLEVILPSLVPDGTISDPATGGTIQDDVFGDRAQVTVPASVLTQPATVSIDVLSSDLHLPIPAGFTTNGTNFVNIKLNPEPTPPFPAPGLTIVLPLLNQMDPGSSLTLYRVDPVSGNLTPEPGIGGGPAVGTVDAGGFSATFTGVASLSTVVGLIPSGAVLGDLDGDGQVNCADIAIVRAAFGKKLGQAGFDDRADTNHDKVVNVRDLAFVSRYLPAGVVCRITPTGAIPSPGTAP